MAFISDHEITRVIISPKARGGFDLEIVYRKTLTDDQTGETYVGEEGVVNKALYQQMGAGARAIVRQKLTEVLVLVNAAIPDA